MHVRRTDAISGLKDLVSYNRMGGYIIPTTLAVLCDIWRFLQIEECEFGIWCHPPIGFFYAAILIRFRCHLYGFACNGTHNASAHL